VDQRLYTTITLLDRFVLAEDYHQKYRLRRVPGVLEELQRIYPALHDFVDSTAAMRINAALGGHLGRRDLEREIEDFGLSPTAQRELRQAV